MAGCFFMVYFAVISCPACVKYFASMGAGEMFFGMLAGIPLLLMFTQYVGAVATNHLKRRKPVFMIIVIIGRFLYLPIVFVPLLFPGLGADYKFAVVLIFVAVSNALLNVAGPLWLSWMADFVPQLVFNRYWGMRQFFMQFSWTVSYLIVGIFTFYADIPITISFPLLAIIGIAAGITDVLLYTKVHEPDNVLVPDKPIMETIIHPLRDVQFQPFVLFSCAWAFSVMFSAAFMQLYAIQELNLTEGQATLIWAAGIANALTAVFWGRMADKHGHKPVLTICVAMKPVVILAFLLVTRQTALWLLPLALLFDSAWEAGILISSPGYMLQKAPQQNRPMFIAAVTGFAALWGGIGAVLGGAFLYYSSGWSIGLMGRTWNNYHLLFTVNIIMRLFCLVLVRRIHEPESTRTEIVLNDILGAWPMRYLLFPMGLYRKYKPKRTT